MYQKNTPPLMSTPSNINQGSLLRATGAQLMGRTAASPSTGPTSFDNTTASPLQYTNSPRSGANIMNTPSPQQQQSHQQQQTQLQQQHQQQRQKMMQLPHQQQLLAQQQLRQSTMPGLGQNQQTQFHDMQNLAQQKFQPMHSQHPTQFSQALAAQQLQGRQLTSAGMNTGSTQLTQGNQLNRHLNQFSSPANSALFNAAQTTPTSQMIPNMSAMMSSQSVLPRMQQFGMSGGNRSLPSQNLSDHMFNMGAGNAAGMIPMQQQQLGAQSAFGNSNMQQTAQNLQSATQMMPVQNNPQNHPNFQQQRQQNQQQ